MYMAGTLKEAIPQTNYMNIDCILWTVQSPYELTLWGSVPLGKGCSNRLRMISKIEMNCVKN